MPESLFNNFISIYYDYCYPILFTDIDRPAFWPVLVTAIIIFITVSEINSHSNKNNKSNKNNSKTINTKPSNKIDEIISRTNLNHTVISWRRSLLLSIVLSLIILAFLYNKLPHGFDFFLVTTILFIVIYLPNIWVQWNWWKNRDYKIENELLDLRHQIKEHELFVDNNRYDPVMRKIAPILHNNF